MRVHIGRAVWHLDVDSTYPPGAGAGKGSAVRRVKGHASWVKYVVRQYGPYLLWEFRNKKGPVLCTQGFGWTNLLFTCCLLKKNNSSKN